MLLWRQAAGDRMDHAEEPSEELVEHESEQADADDQRNREHGRRNPLVASWPRNAPKFRDDAADEIASRDRLSRSLLLFVHQRFTCLSS